MPGGVSFTFDWVGSESRGSDGRCTVEPTHVGTTLWGLPLPLSMLRVQQRMRIHDDDRGWDLLVAVTALGGRLHLITYEGSMRRVDHTREDAAVGADDQGIIVDGFHDLVLFDGVCNLCNTSVDFLLTRDVNQRLLFCTQQSPEAQAILQRHGHSLPPLQGRDASVLVLGADGLLRAKSDAALRAGQALGGGWSLLANLASVVPMNIRNYAYDVVGRNRYRWFGKKAACRLPTPGERRRFLQT